MADPIRIVVPDIGDFDSVDVVEVLVSPGEHVDIEAGLITLESDKASMEVPSTHSGVVLEVAVSLGDKVAEGDLIVVLDAADESHPDHRAERPRHPHAPPARSGRSGEAAAAAAGRVEEQAATPAPERVATPATASRHNRSTPKCWCWAPVRAATPRPFAPPT